jgi:hypothetical protein
MKKSLFLALVCVLISSGLLAQKMNKAQKAVKAAIENETKLFDQRNFEAWSAAWVHAPETYWSVAGPSSSYYGELVGWDAISEWGSNTMKNDPEPNESTQQKTDYMIRIVGDMAYANFTEDGNRTVRLLQKVDDQWKMLSMVIVGTAAYKQRAQEEMVESMAGTWEVETSSLKMTGTPNKMTKGMMEIKLDQHGMEIAGSTAWLTPEGNTQTVNQKNRFSMDSGTEAVGVISSVNGSGFNGESWSNVSTGNAEMTDDMLIKVKNYRVGREKAGYSREFSMTPEGKLHLEQHFWNAEGEETWSMAFDMVKK